MFAIGLHMAVYGVYREHMQVSSSCAVGRKIASLTTPLQIVMALASHASLNHKLFNTLFCSCSFDTVSTKLGHWLLQVLTYVLIDYVCRWEGTSTEQKWHKIACPVVWSVNGNFLMPTISSRS